MSEENLIQTTKFQFPLSIIKKPDDFLDEISQPITFTLDEIKQDMYSYAKNFPKQIIPHIKEGGAINDIIHNYQRSKPLKQKQEEKVGNDYSLDDKKQVNSLEAAKPKLTHKNITAAQKEIQKTSSSKLIGLVAHLAYWNVFGHFNKLPLDLYHRRQIFISFSTLRDQLNAKYHGLRSYYIFMTPMLILALRLEIEVIFKNQYPKFFAEEHHEKNAMKLINDLITQLLDPNLLFSRFSFFESGRDAINIKYHRSKL